jgi:hypothetical protein
LPVTVPSRFGARLLSFDVLPFHRGRRHFSEKKSHCFEKVDLVREGPLRRRRSLAGCRLAPFVVSTTDRIRSRAIDDRVEKKSGRTGTDDDFLDEKFG